MTGKPHTGAWQPGGASCSTAGKRHGVSMAGAILMCWAVTAALASVLPPATASNGCRDRLVMLLGLA